MTTPDGPAPSAEAGTAPGAARPPQSPELGRRTYRVFWYRLHRYGAVRLSAWTMPLTISLFTAFFFLRLRQVRRAVISNLEAVLGPAGPLTSLGRAWRTIWNQAWCNSERYERLGTERPFRVEVEGQEHWYGVAEGRDEGFVLVTAHVGSWDVSSLVPSLVIDRHVHVVREQEVDPEAQAFIEDLYRREASPYYTVHFSRDNPQLGTRLLTALRRGEIVGLQGDRPSTTGRAVDTTFFGRPLAMPLGPAALVRAAQVPLLPVFCFRTGRRSYRLVIRPPFEAPRTDDPTRDHQDLMQRIVQETEWAIRQEPHQWFCLKELWP